MAEREERRQARVLALLRRHGWNATSFQVLEPGLRYFFHGEGCVAYVDTGQAFVVAGAPIAPEERIGAVAERFAAFAARCGRRLRFFAVADRFLELAPFASMQIGEQPSWDPADWEATLRSSRSLREQLRRARARGVRIRLLDPGAIAGERVRIEALIARWLGSRQMAPMGFLVAIHPFGFPRERRYFVAEIGERMVGFLAAIPIYRRNGWFFEDLLRDPRAPNGTAELLVDAAMRAVAAEGSRYVTLGLAPLAGVSGWLRTAGRLGRRLYDFRGLAAFKSRLRPGGWEAIHLAYPAGERGFRAIVDSLSAFSRSGLLRFGIETLLLVPPIVIEALAWLAIPWTLLLAAAPARYFPAPRVQAGWVGFDLLLIAGLFRLARRWQPRLATLLAASLTGDLLLTLAQVLLWNLPRARSAIDAAAALAAVLVPAAAAALLWTARRRRGELRR